MSDNKKIITHSPVMLEQALQELKIDPEKEQIFLDVTFGRGGHSRAILEASPKAKVFAMDWSLEVFENIAPEFEELYKSRFVFVWAGFQHLYKTAKKHKFPKFDGILADFGTSQNQIFSDLGLSFRSQDYLDMRMSKAHAKKTAANLLNELSEKELSDIFWNYGEERFSRKIASEIVKQRAVKRINYANELAELVIKIKGWDKKNRTHPATKIFQALRIAVNDEINNIQEFLKEAPIHLADKGVFVCISFHSLEDREVKTSFKSLCLQEQCSKNSKLFPSDEEIEKNPSSRSAVMRILTK